MTPKQKTAIWLFKRGVQLFLGFICIAGWMLAQGFLFNTGHGIAGIVVLSSPIIACIGFMAYVSYKEKLKEFEENENE